MSCSKSVYGVFLFCAIIATVFSIKCFQCNSFEDIGCADLKSNETKSPYYKSCNEIGHNLTFCRKTTQRVKDSKDFNRVIRSCGWVPHKSNDTGNCLLTDSDFKMETSCQCFSDACNSGRKQMPELGAIVVVTSLICRFSN